MSFNPKYYTKEQIREYAKKYYYARRKKKIQEDRKKNPTYKICPMCGTKFESTHNRKYCCEACRSLAYKIKQKIYKETDRYKESVAKHKQTKGYKQKRAEYSKSEKYKEIRKRYWSSKKGKATARRYYLKRKANGGKPLSKAS